MKLDSNAECESGWKCGRRVGEISHHSSIVLSLAVKGFCPSGRGMSPMSMGLFMRRPTRLEGLAEIPETLATAEGRSEGTPAGENADAHSRRPRALARAREVREKTMFLASACRFQHEERRKFMTPRGAGTGLNKNRFLFRVRFLRQFLPAKKIIWQILENEMMVSRFSTTLRLGQAALLPIIATAFAPSFAPSLGHRHALYSGLRPASSASTAASLFGRRAHSAQGVASLRSAYTTSEKGSFPSEVDDVPPSTL